MCAMTKRDAVNNSYMTSGLSKPTNEHIHRYDRHCLLTLIGPLGNNMKIPIFLISYL